MLEKFDGLSRGLATRTEDMRMKMEGVALGTSQRAVGWFGEEDAVIR
jgi:hypothetical protein